MSIPELSAIAGVPLVFWLAIRLINWAAARKLKRPLGKKVTGTHVTRAGLAWTAAMLSTLLTGLAWVTFHPSSWLGHFVQQHGINFLVLALLVPFLFIARLLRHWGVVLFTKGGSGA